MRHTGGGVRGTHVPAQGDQPSQESAQDPTAQRVLLTLAVRDYPDDDNHAEFAEGIDQQLSVVGEWWQTPGTGQPFRQVGPAEELKNREQVEDFLRREHVRELRAQALVVFITGHGIAGKSDTHFLRLPDTVVNRPLATAVRTADVVGAALDSHAKNVLVIVNTCFAGNMHSDLAAVEKEIRPSRRESAQLDVLVTCGLTTKIEVLRFPGLLRAALERLRRTAGITSSHLSVPEFMAQYAQGLGPHEEKKFKLHHLIQGGTLQPSPCLPNPGYTPLPEPGSALHGYHPQGTEHWLECATGRPRESDPGWYFRGRERLGREIARFVQPAAPAGVLLVTGCAGSGKSAVLARAVTLSDPAFRREPLYKTAEAASAADTIPPEGAISAAVSARNADAAHVATHLLRALGATPAPAGVTDDPVAVWSRQLQDGLRTPGDPVTLVLDALDEAQEPARIVSDVLAPLGSLCGQPAPPPREPRPGLGTGPRERRYEQGEGDGALPCGRRVRLLIGVRSSRPVHAAQAGPPAAAPTGASGAEEGAGLLQALRHVFPAARTERTDGDEGKQDVELYLRALVGDVPAAGCLQQELAHVADAVWPSFIDARLAGHQLRNTPDPVALARNPRWHRATLTHGIRGLLRSDLRAAAEDGLPAHVALALLKASAYAKGQGVPWAEVWPAIAGVFLLPRQLPPEEWDQMIAKLLDSRLSGYLAQSVEDERRVYRPAHEELAAELLRPGMDLLDTDTGHGRDHGRGDGDG